MLGNAFLLSSQSLTDSLEKFILSNLSAINVEYQNSIFHWDATFKMIVILTDKGGHTQTNSIA